MSTLREAAEFTGLLNPDDYAVLSSLVELLPNHRYIPIDLIDEHSGLPSKKIEFSLGKLEGLNLIVKDPHGYRIVYSGLDALALHRLRSRGALDGVGLPLALGKESDVYEGTSNGEPVAVKAFRIGRISFRDIKRKRGYLSRDVHEWLVASMRSAAREYANLTMLSGKGLPVPTPMMRSLHMIVMSKVSGILLRYIRDVSDPRGLLLEILSGVRDCYTKGGLVNADLSEFNILVEIEDFTWRTVHIIDWPQAVPASHVNASDLLRRDVYNVLRFFSKRFKVDISMEWAFRYVTGLTNFI